jgi:hypothetical protein
MRTLKLLATLAVIAFPLSAVEAAGPGECGEFMYWKDGACRDARNAASPSWTEQMAKKSTW